jgi:hypothetical protein
MDRETWLALRPYLIGAVAILIAFQMGREAGSNEARPDEEACREWAEAMQNAAYAWRDVAFAAADPEGHSDPLGRTPAERAQTGQDQLAKAEDISHCSFIPRDSWPPPF